MFFSIIIPVYNRPEELSELLESLTAQTYKHFEVVVIEDGSTKKSDALCADFAQKLAIQYYFQENTGQGFARNAGFKLAKGDFFIILDSDCVLPSQYLVEVLKGITAKNLDVFGAPDKAAETFSPLQKALNYALTAPLSTGGLRGNHTSTYLPRSFNMGLHRRVWEKIGGFEITRLGEDLIYSLRMLAAGFRVGFLPNAFVYHKRRTSFSGFARQMQFFGRSRINVALHFPQSLKFVHFLPTFFLLGMLFAFFMAGFGAFYFLYMYIGYALLVSIDAWTKEKNLRIALYALWAVFLQHSCYGYGFLKDYLRCKICKQPNIAHEYPK
jgi:glycosyltransferase involved in cell wall biosynthesis